MDDLSVALNNSGIGGYLGDAFLNHFCYADDICLISLSSSGTQQLLNICQNYATNHELLYNIDIVMIMITILQLMFLENYKMSSTIQTWRFRPKLLQKKKKLLESVLLLKCSDYLTTCDNQFGFKASHGRVIPCQITQCLKQYPLRF